MRHPIKRRKRHSDSYKPLEKPLYGDELLRESSVDEFADDFINGESGDSEYRYTSDEDFEKRLARIHQEKEDDKND
jgi:hypothetical protein